MQQPLRTAVWINRISLVVLIFAASFLWFCSRQLSFLLSAALAGAFSLLSIFALILIHQKLQQKTDYTKKQKQMRYALSMLPYDLALDHAAAALADRYGLILPDTAQGKASVNAYDKANGVLIAVALDQDPVRVQKRSVHAFHRTRGNCPAVLVCTSAPQQDAVTYAETLSPPLRLLEVSEFPYDAALCAKYPMPQEDKKKRAAFALLKSGRAQAVRCMVFSFWMIFFYLLTERLSILLPALTLAFYALLCKRNVRKETLF